MALKQPISISFWRKVRLVVLLVVSPSRYEALRAPYDAALETQPDDKRSPATTLRAALCQSFMVMVSAAFVGVIAGWGASGLFGRSDSAIAFLQMAGVSILLWATLAVRGWEIQSFAGVTVTERVNLWIYRALFFLGTALLVMPAVWFLASS